MRVILGSSSPRRREILGNMLGSFEVLVPEVDEALQPGEAPEPFARRMAAGKAQSLLARLGAGDADPFLLITCDTIVTIDGMTIGKPAGPEDARNIIALLSGKTHQVISALTLADSRRPAEAITDAEASRVTFKALDAAAIAEYLGRIDYLDKAGAYAVQEHGSFIIERIEGSVTNVIGFPLRLLFRMAASLGLLDTLFPGAEANMDPSRKSKRY